MKSLLVPVDFTQTSGNAVQFAIEWSRKYGYDQIILLKSYFDSIFASVTIAAEYSYYNQDTVNAQHDTAKEELERLCEDVAIAAPHAKVVTVLSELPLVRALLEVVREQRPELVIAGSDNEDHSTDSIVAGNVISIAKLSPVRVLIVPAGTKYHPVTDALLPFDFNALHNLDKMATMHTAVQWHEIRLHVLNVDPKERFLNEDEALATSERLLREKLSSFPHELHYRNDKTVIGGILEFVKEHPVQLIVALPGKHSFLYSLTHASISEAIYRNSGLPVLILK